MSKPGEQFYLHEKLDSVEGDATEYIRGDIVEALRQQVRDGENARTELEAEVKRLQNELTQLRTERSGAINIARVICHDNDWWNGWPDTLHLADVIEKRIYNLCLDWRRATKAAEGERNAKQESKRSDNN